MQAAANNEADTDRELIQALLEAARDFGARGWTPATSGNYSVRLDDGTLLVTRSGADKRRLATTDLMRLDAEGTPLEDSRPSAEASLHVQIYRHDPTARAVLHVHSPAATVMSRRAAIEGVVRLENYELLKALRGVETHALTVELPVVANDQDMARLAAALEPGFTHPACPPAYLIEGHGIYAWGTDVAEAARHLEALDFILECELLETR
ncbi:MAG TPA: methylthioribulose 1-phosphate dehydratase [Wenzhouxiangellaceae bacterium]|nr:methylthioribulose 1-phosphate dehydratase [Wenzhouxiangellaceae bacterium]